jgi:hypothetical protein
MEEGTSMIRESKIPRPVRVTTLALLGASALGLSASSASAQVGASEKAGVRPHLSIQYDSQVAEPEGEVRLRVEGGPLEGRAWFLIEGADGLATPEVAAWSRALGLEGEQALTGRILASRPLDGRGSAELFLPRTTASRTATRPPKAAT